MSERTKAFFINGGAGRVLCSIPALEKYAEETSKDFIIVCEGGADFYRGHPILHERAYDHWHKNLFEDKLINCDLETPEPYRIWEYFNQKCSIAQAYDIAINNKGIRELQRPFLKLSNDEKFLGYNIVKEVKEKTKKEKVIVFQPFGRGVKAENNIIFDLSGRSFEGTHVINIVKKLQKAGYAVILMSEIGIDFAKHGCKDPVAIPQNVALRQWAGIISQADYFFGCDSVGQHIAVALDKPGTVVLGSTFAVNVSYPDYEKFDILDMGGQVRRYSPIRITMDDVADRGNDGIMQMNDKIEDVIVESVVKGIEKFKNSPTGNSEVSITTAPAGCPTC
jgi:hypothetical protein